MHISNQPSLTHLPSPSTLQSLTHPINLGFDVIFFLLFLGIIVISAFFFTRLDMKASKKIREKYPPNQII